MVKVQRFIVVSIRLRKRVDNKGVGHRLVNIAFELPLWTTSIGRFYGIVRVHGHSCCGLNQRTAASRCDGRANRHASKDCRLTHTLTLLQFTLKVAHFSFTLWAGASAVALMGAFRGNQLNVVLRGNLLSDFL